VTTTQPTSDSPTRGKGRPKLSQDIARTKRVVTFVTAQEFAMLQEYAGSRSSSLSATCHKLLCDALKNVLPVRTIDENQKQRSNSNET
jgi:hypothetical protein